MADKIRIVLVDDHDFLRQGLRALLSAEEDLEVIGEASDGAQAVEVVCAETPDVVVMDLEMPNMDGIQATRAIRQSCPDTKILILTSTMEDDKLFPVLRAGANGYLMKSADGKKIAEGVRTVYGGEPLLHPDVARRLMAEAGSGPSGGPEGTVTILFTDIEGSTMIVAELGDEAARAIFREHDQILRDVMRRHAGTEVKHQGDGFMIAFGSARSAVLCAIDIQQEIARHNKKRPRAAVKVRMGLNTGEAISENKDYFGEAVILASRISAKAHGGQIYISELTKSLIGTTAGVRFIDKGSHRLKGLKGTHKVFEVPWGKNSS